MIKPFQFFLLLISPLLVFECKNPSSKNDFPEKLVIGFTGSDAPEEKMSNFKLLARYLEKETGIKRIDTYQSDDYTSIIEGMRSKKVDIAHLGELSYIMAAYRANARAIVTTSKKDGSYFARSIIITNSKTGLKSMDDVKKRAKRLTLTFGDPASTSGHLYPRNYMSSIGLDPEKSFKSVVFTNVAAAAVFTVISGKVDVACVMKPTVDWLIRTNKLKREDLVILWSSEPYITTPVCVRNDLPANLISRIQKAYVDLPVKDPEIWKQYVKVVYKMYPDEMRKEFTYVPCCDSMYNGIRRMAKRNSSFDLFKSIR